MWGQVSNLPPTLQASRLGSILMIMIMVIIVIIIVIVDRPQEVLEGPLGHLPALPPRHCVREAEVDALVDAGTDHLVGRIREAAIRAGVLDSRWVATRQ